PEHLPLRIPNRSGSSKQGGLGGSADSVQRRCCLLGVATIGVEEVLSEAAIEYFGIEVLRVPKGSPGERPVMWPVQLVPNGDWEVPIGRGSKLLSGDRPRIGGRAAQTLKRDCRRYERDGSATSQPAHM